MSNHKSKKSINLWNFVKNHQQWFGFILVVVALIYAYVTLLFESIHPILDIIYAILFILLIYGLFCAFKTEQEETKHISFKSWDGVYAALGVIVTYSMVHFLGLSAVLASGITGLLGYVFLKKYEVAIYCGSFAGMVSVALFNYYEVAVLALVCGFIFILTKPLFAGYGGKLGTVAFMSSLITFSLFHEEYLLIETDFNFWLLIMTTIFGAVITFTIQHKLKTSAVLASASTSVVFALILIYLVGNHIEYTIIFFSSSFVGMSSKNHLPNILVVAISGLILGLIYYVFIEYFHGLGGKLGLMAMMSVMITSGMIKIGQKQYIKLRQT